MSNVYRIKRRANGGGAGAPASLLNGELAFNEQTQILYYGFGDAGGGVASSVMAVAGPGYSTPVTSGGTGQTAVALGDILYGSGTNTWARLTGNTVAAKRFLTQTGNGSVSAAPSWGTIVDGDLPSALTGKTYNGLTVTTTTGTFTLASGKTATVNNTLTFNGTDGSTVAFGTGGTVVYTSNHLGVHAATTSAQLAGVISDETGSGSLVFATSPTLVTPTLGVATATSINKVAITAPTTSATLTIADGKTFTSSNTLTLAGTDGSTLNIGTGGTLGTAAYTASTAYYASTLPLNSITAPTGPLAMNSQRITGLQDPTNAQDAATKAYVDSIASGIDVKNSVRVATVTALPAYTRVTNTITANANGALPTIDGVSLAVNDRVLLKNGAANADNGIYYVSQLGNAGAPFILIRATDADVSTEVTTGMFTFVEEGSTLANTGWILTTAAPITLNTTGLSFTQFSGAGTYTAGTGLTLTGSQFSISTGYTGQTSITTLGTIGTGTWQATAIGAIYGGTGLTTYTTGDLIQATATNTLGRLAAVATGNVLISGGVGTASSWGKVGLTTHVSGTLPVGNGGTGLTTFSTGDLIQATAANTLSALAAVATGNVLLSGGVGTASSWGKVGLTTHVTGILPTANGGTGSAFFAVAGPTVARTYTFPDQAATIMYDGQVIDGGTF